MANQERELLRELSSARRSHFLENNDKLAVIVKGYFVIIVAALLVDIISTSSTYFVPTSSDIAFFHSNANNYGTALFLFILFLGAMLGTRGGPLTVHRPEMRMVFLSDVGRERLLRQKAIRTLFHYGYIGAAGGGGVGVALHALSHHQAATPAIDFGIFGIACGFAYAGMALLSVSFSLSGIKGYALGLVLILVGVVPILSGSTSPIAVLGGPLKAMSPTDLQNMVVLATGLVIGILGVLRLPKADLEPIERHSELISRLRFAIGMRDVRSIIGISRSLGENGYVGRRLPKIAEALFRTPKSTPSLRSLSNIYNWSIKRYIRLFILNLSVVFIIANAWLHSVILFFVAVPLCFVMGLELSDSVGSLVDKADRFVNYPVEDGWLLNRSTMLPAAIAIVLTLVSDVIVYFLVSGTTFSILLPLSVAMAITSVFGGAVAQVRSGKGQDVSAFVLVPEVQAFKFFIELIPVIIANAWIVAAINAHGALAHHSSASSAALSASSFVLIAPLAGWAWIGGQKILKAE
ncbi:MULTISPECIES: hypothetical protein [Acidithrix]|uniref:Uncharacterized protein n=1 Tax=Acidithrix ferrooxidans TaxID=1280514 RepID=A0A0D8HHB9_9ACTN|nr:MULTISPECIES: hypothetical protein [Acidithrix]KJF16456.1 hypothetical protein AXFE_26860 [Acidithrix ferrooxidans]